MSLNAIEKAILWQHNFEEYGYGTSCLDESPDVINDLVEYANSITDELKLLSAAVLKSHYLSHTGSGSKAKKERYCPACETARKYTGGE